MWRGSSLATSSTSSERFKLQRRLEVPALPVAREAVGVGSFSRDLLSRSRPAPGCCCTAGASNRSVSAYLGTQYTDRCGASQATFSGVGRRLDVDLMVGSYEIAERLGVSRHQVVHDWRRRHPDFPEPVLRLRQALIWYWPEVEQWARTTGRLA
jgi:hypothetical protein